MRIGFCIYGDIGQCTGGYIYDRYLIGHLQDRGHRVELISLPAGSCLQKLSCNVSPRLVRTISRLNLDILIQDALCLPSLIGLNRLLGRYHPLPRIALVHQLVHLRRENGRRRRLDAWLEKSYLDSTDAIIVNSGKLDNTIREELGVRRPALVAKPGGDRLGGVVPRERILERCDRDGPLNLFFLGNVLPNKGLHTLIGILKEMDPATWNLSVAGSLEMDGVYSGYIRKIIAEYNIASNVRLLGRLSREEVKREMVRHHLLAMPYSIEGFGIAYLEGMSQGLPAIGSTEGGAGEIISHGENGFLVDVGGGDALRAHLSRLYRHRDELREMSMAALDCFAGFSTWKQSMEQIGSFVEDFPVT